MATPTAALAKIRPSSQALLDRGADSIIGATRVRVSPYRRAQFRNLGRLAKSHVEHDRVVVAILRGDRDGAAAAMRAHIVTVSEEYWEYAKGV